MITAAMQVHTELGPGLLESSYSACLQFELADAGYRCSAVHQAQILSYLKLSGKSLGLLINFNVVHLKDGIRRFVNGTGWK